MSCDCINNVEKKVLDLFNKENPGKIISERISLEHTALMLTKNGGVRLHGKVSGKYEDGKRNRNWSVNLSFNYCPFCGKKYKSDSPHDSDNPR